MGCEPFLLHDRRTAPRYDSIFVGQGKDRASFHYELAARRNVSMAVVPGVFVHLQLDRLTEQSSRAGEFDYMVGESCWPAFTQRIALQYNWSATSKEQQEIERFVVDHAGRSPVPLNFSIGIKANALTGTRDGPPRVPVCASKGSCVGDCSPEVAVLRAGQPTFEVVPGHYGGRQRSLRLAEEDQKAAKPTAGAGTAGAPPRRDWLVVVSVGSEQRPEYLRAQRATWARHQTFVTFTEKEAQPCSGQCVVPGPNRSSHRRRRDRWAEERESPDWRCQQQRPLEAIRRVAMDYPNASWYMVVHDDTFVNVAGLRGLLEQYPLPEAEFFGHLWRNDGRLKSSTMVSSYYKVLGGAGFVLHHGAVQRLLRPSVVSRPIGHARRGLSLRGVSRKTIDACIERMSAGPWCSWHADWAVAECLDKVGVQPVGHPRFGQYTCDKRSLSCHNVGPRQQRSLWNRLLRDWFPCDSPYAGPEEDARRARVSRCAPPHGGKLSDPMGVKEYNYSADGLTKEGYMAL